MKIGEYMSRTRFEAIILALKYTDKPPSNYKDGFWEVIRLIDEWKSNMDKHFTPYWLSCMDESMSKWLNEYTCPGFMCVPINPWSFGNKYHTIACDLTRVLYQMDIFRGKYIPIQRPPKVFSDLGKTVGLLLQIDKTIVARYQACYS